MTAEIWSIQEEMSRPCDFSLVTLIITQATERCELLFFSCQIEFAQGIWSWVHHGKNFLKVIKKMCHLFIINLYHENEDRDKICWAL